MDTSFNLSVEEVFKMYGELMLVGGVSALLGGLLGLMKQPKILSLVGLGLQALGTGLIVMNQSSDLAYTGFAVMVIGSGIFKTNAGAFLGQLYNRSNLLDSAFMINYLVINTGAFLGVLAISYLFDKQGAVTAFLACSGAYIIAMVLMYVTVEERPKYGGENDPEIKAVKRFSYSEIDISLIIIVALLILVGSIFYWGNIEKITPEITVMIRENPDLSYFGYNEGININFIGILVLGVGLAILYSFRKISTALKASIGFLVAALGIWLLDIQEGNISTMADVLLIYFVCQTIAEVLINPTLHAYIIRKVPLMFAPLALGGIFFIITAAAKLGGMDQIDDLSTVLQNGLFYMLLFGGLLLGTFFITSQLKKENGSGQQT